MALSEAQAKQLLGKYYVPANASKTARKGRNKPKQCSPIEHELSLHLRAYSVPFEREFKFCSTRRWKADFRITGTRILVEVEGGTWSGGRHVRPQGYAADCEKYSWAAVNGWIVLRYTSDQIYSGKAVSEILKAINQKLTVNGAA